MTLVLRLTLWRPQRIPIPTETGWIDIGRPNYTAGLADVGRVCQQPAFSEDDATLVVHTFADLLRR